MDNRTGWGCESSDDEECYGLMYYEKPIMVPIPGKLPNADITDFPLKLSSDPTSVSTNKLIKMQPTSLNISGQPFRQQGMDHIINSVDNAGNVVQSPTMVYKMPEGELDKIHFVDDQDAKFEAVDKVNPSKMIGAGVSETKDEKMRILELMRHPLQIDMTKTEFQKKLEELPTIEYPKDDVKEKPEDDVANKSTIPKRQDDDEKVANQSTIQEPEDDEKVANQSTVSVKDSSTNSSAVSSTKTDEKSPTTEPNTSSQSVPKPADVSDSHEKNFKNALPNKNKGKRRRYTTFNRKPDFEFVSEEDDMARAKKHKFKFNFV